MSKYITSTPWSMQHQSPPLRKISHHVHVTAVVVMPLYGAAADLPPKKAKTYRAALPMTIERKRSKHGNFTETVEQLEKRAAVFQKRYGEKITWLKQKVKHEEVKHYEQ